jgi:hypothetical protein
VVIFGLYDPKTGSKLGLSGPKWCHKLGCNTLKPKPGSNLGYGPQNGVRNGLFTQKLDLWTAFGYMGFSVYGLFGSGAFGYTGFSVYGLFGSHPNYCPNGLLYVKKTLYVNWPYKREDGEKRRFEINWLNPFHRRKSDRTRIHVCAHCTVHREENCKSDLFIWPHPARIATTTEPFEWWRSFLPH